MSSSRDKLDLLHALSVSGVFLDAFLRYEALVSFIPRRSVRSESGGRGVPGPTLVVSLRAGGTMERRLGLENHENRARLQMNIKHLGDGGSPRRSGRKHETHLALVLLLPDLVLRLGLQDVETRVLHHDLLLLLGQLDWFLWNNNLGKSRFGLEGLQSDLIGIFRFLQGSPWSGAVVYKALDGNGISLPLLVGFLYPIQYMR